MRCLINKRKECIIYYNQDNLPLGKTNMSRKKIKEKQVEKASEKNTELEEEKEEFSLEQIEKLKSALEEKTKEAAQYRENWLRSMADLDNYCKRMEKERSEYFKFSNERMIKELLPVLDNFQKAIEHGRSSSNRENLLNGIELTLKMFQQCLEKFGLKPIKTIGESFDPNFHEAVRIEETKENEKDNIVVEEYQKGYLLNERLLRPALVVVNKAKVK